MFVCVCVTSRRVENPTWGLVRVRGVDGHRLRGLQKCMPPT